MSTPSQDGSTPQQWETAGADQGRPYGQPFDPTVSSPKQQPPPPGWEQGTWTSHGEPAPAAGNGRLLLVGIVVLVVVIIAAAVVVMLA
ncbi:hypothetical protein [Mycobacterium antarcticum]|uniref:hypothetical protein n=1 Tax=Mycolicibacterium sp. TUM20984 TaxID=3023368 RepID=UPI00239121B6|nr:hypothetical protein [Mycolicibacterium sp. TUM20984]GLP78692.1 hypothetical protein TUM20984_01120 [Mycolicibacterium sp. TUM20984]